jgi:hypothetical protein
MADNQLFEIYLSVNYCRSSSSDICKKTQFFADKMLIIDGNLCEFAALRMSVKS